jgi:signal transduction histidine kinase
MGGSILLLAGFEFVWIRSEYTREYEALEDTQTQRFHEIIRELEDSIFQSALLTKTFPEQDSAHAFEPHFRVAIDDGSIDTARVISVIRRFDHRMHDTLRHVQWRGRKRTMILGGLLQRLSTDTDSVTQQQVLQQMLNAKLHSLPEDPLSTQLQLIVWKDSIPSGAGTVSRPFFDVFSERQYGLSFPGYHGYLLRLLTPQILFALFLFSCISAAFFMISRSLARQRKLALMRSNLISNITHELKTPISTVSVALEALQNFHASEDTSRRKEYLGIAQSEISRLSLLVDKVLRASHAENGKTELKIELFNMKDLITQILDTLKVQFTRVSANVDFTTGEGDFIIEGDKTHLSGLVYNLVDNALKYGGPSPEIKIHLEQKKDELVLAVADNGIGIPSGFRDRIFEKFFRVPSGDVHNTKGHGLGLSYVAQVVQDHGGRIDLQSEEGSGSVFTVSLPIRHVS